MNNNFPELKSGNIVYYGDGLKMLTFLYQKYKRLNDIMNDERVEYQLKLKHKNFYETVLK